MSYTVNLLWDADASVWVVTSEDIKGLVLCLKVDRLMCS